MKRFELRKSPVDGKVRRWDVMRAKDVKGLYLTFGPDEMFYDYPVAVVTGVYNNKKEALRAAGIKVR